MRWERPWEKQSAVFGAGHVKMLMGHPRGAWTREDVCVGDINLFGSYRTWTIFEAITLDEITKGENLDRKEKLEEKHSGERLLGRD